MMPLVSSESDATIWSITLELPIMIQEALFTHIYGVYGIGVTYDDRQLMFKICL
jgi:hypothetical protein